VLEERIKSHKERVDSASELERLREELAHMANDAGGDSCAAYAAESARMREALEDLSETRAGLVDAKRDATTVPWRHALHEIATGNKGDWSCNCPAGEIARAALKGDE